MAVHSLKRSPALILTTDGKGQICLSVDAVTAACLAVMTTLASLKVVDLSSCFLVLPSFARASSLIALLQ